MDLDKIEELIELGIDPKLIRLYFETRDKSLLDYLKLIYNYRKIERIFSLHQMIPSIELEGEIYIGEYFDNGWLPLRISKELINQHIAIFARSGYGKTTLIENIVSQLVKEGIPFTLFDFKREYRHLGMRHDEIVIFRRGMFKLNILEPPYNVPIHIWEGYLADLLAYNYGWYHGSRNLFQEYLHRLYLEKGENVNFEDLYEYVKEADRKYRREYYEVVLNRLYSISRNLTDYISSRKFVDLEDILNGMVVIEVDGIPKAEQSLLVEYLLLWTYLYRLYNTGVVNRLLHVFVFDEAKRIFDVTKEYRGTTQELGVHLLSIIADEIRGLGEGLIISDQEPSKISKSILANSAVKIVGELGSGEDIHIIEESLNLNEDQIRQLNMLRKGYWMIKIAGYLNDPKILRVHPKYRRRSVSDEKLDRKYSRVIPGFYKKVSKKYKKLLRDLMNSVYEKPYLSISERISELGFTAKVFESLKKKLISLGLVEELEINFGRGRPKKFLVPKYKFLRRKRCRIGGGTQHRFLVLVIKSLYEYLGFNTVCESKIGEYRVDILCKNKGIKICFEVVDTNPPDTTKLDFLTGKCNLLYVILNSVNDDFRAFDKAVVFCSGLYMLKKARNILLNSV